MTFNLRSALNFIDKNGNDFQKNYFKALFDSRYLERTLKCLAPFQNLDGGWIGIDPDYKGKCSSKICTLLVLGRFERLGVNSGELFDPTISYLKREQKSTGGWDESIGVLNPRPPAWYFPRLIINQVMITNAIIRFLISRKPEETEMISRAQEFVRKFWNGRRFPGDYKPHNWMSIVSFKDNARNIYEGCMENLRNEMSVLDLGDVCWAMESLMYLSISKEDSIVQDGLKRLEVGQAENGSLATNYSDVHRVGNTMSALEILVHYDQSVRKHLFALMKEEKWFEKENG